MLNGLGADLLALGFASLGIGRACAVVGLLELVVGLGHRVLRFGSEKRPILAAATALRSLGAPLAAPMSHLA